MRHILVLIGILITNSVQSQSGTKINEAYSFITQNKIKLNAVTAPKGFKIYYNCDSMLFMKGNFGDTIKIWTPGIEGYEELEEFEKTMKNEKYGKTIFAKEVYSDGRIMVEYYHETQFIYRNDSLFEIKNIAEFPLSKNLVSFSDDAVNKEEFERIQDSIATEFKKSSVFVPKLIFTKSMFKGERKEIKLSKNVNFMGDTIILESKWKENDKVCYLIRIKNQEQSYAYAINELMEFIQWEGCYLK